MPVVALPTGHVVPLLLIPAHIFWTEIIRYVERRQLSRLRHLLKFASEDVGFASPRRRRKQLLTQLCPVVAEAV